MCAFTTLPPLHEVLRIRTCYISNFRQPMRLSICFNQTFCWLVTFQAFGLHFLVPVGPLVKPQNRSWINLASPLLKIMQPILFLLSHLCVGVFVFVFYSFTLSPDHPAVAQHLLFALLSASVYLVPSYLTFFIDILHLVFGPKSVFINWLF